MTLKVEVLDEPELIFGGGSRCVDPKIGLLQSGPVREGGEREPLVIHAGAVGTVEAVAKLRQMLQLMRHRLAPGDDVRTKPWLVDFPGLGGRSRLGFDVRLEEDKIEHIWPEDEVASLRSDDRFERIETVVQMYERKISALVDASGAVPPQLLLLPLSARMLERCRDPNTESDDVVYHRRTMARKRRRVPKDYPVLDLHNVLKVIGIQHHVPVQVLKPRTLLLHADQDPATTAWNIAVAAYYKGTGSPWKLADLEEDTCHVGVSFFVEVGEEATMRAAMAQVYLRTGESQVIRGKPFRWSPGQGRRRSPVLTEEQAGEILTDVLEVYRGQWHRDPRRIVIHKSSSFLKSEMDGFVSAAGSVEKLDLVHIFSKSDTRLFHLHSGYPPLRGTLLWSDGSLDGLLYTSGFVQAFSSYLGPSVPWPIRFRCDRLSTSIPQVAADIMALTKLDWNNTNFSTSDPVTLSVADKVGQILSESKARQLAPPQGYRYYM